MKRFHPLDDVKKKGRITADTGTSTGSATAIKNVEKDEVGLRSETTSTKREKRERRRKDDASSAERIKNEWTLDELDLNRDIPSLISLIDDKNELVNQLFSILRPDEVDQLIPDVLKEIALNKLKQMCFEELQSMPEIKIKQLLGEQSDGRGNETAIKRPDENANKMVNEAKTLQSDPNYDIQLRVDDEEYKTFLGSEKIDEKAPLLMKDAQIQVELSSSSESSSDEEDDNKSHDDEKDEDECNEGWMNLWTKTQMEILELEMRARVIRSLIKVQNNDDDKINSIRQRDDDDDDVEDLKDNRNAAPCFEKKNEIEKTKTEMNEDKETALKAPDFLLNDDRESRHESNYSGQPIEMSFLNTSECDQSVDNEIGANNQLTCNANISDPTQEGQENTSAERAECIANT